MISDMAMFEHINTKAVDSPIEIPLMSDVVVARVGHMPRRSTNVGFSLINPLAIIFKLFICCMFFRRLMAFALSASYGLWCVYEPSDDL